MNREQVMDFLHGECEKLPPDRNVYFKRNGDAWFCCPWHGGGMERTPSCKVNIDPNAPAALGHFYCFGCHVKGPWSELAELFDLRTLKKSQVQEANSGDTYLRRRNFDLDDSQVPDLQQMALWQPDIPWRGIPGHTVMHYNGRATAFGKKALLYLPALIYGEHVGGIQAVLVRDRKNKKQKAYVNTSGAWSHNAVFGFDIAAALEDRLKPLWIVEGPRDVMWVNACGGRAVGLIGSAVTTAKLQLIRDLDPPCIVVATDPDEAGEGAAVKLLEVFKNELPTEQLPFKAGQDPATLKPQAIERINKKMRRLIKC